MGWIRVLQENAAGYRVPLCLVKAAKGPSPPGLTAPWGRR